MNYKSFFHIGTASWAIPKEFRARFLEAPSILEKYALKFNAVEINSSFYRDHQAKTYAKWAEMTPATFRFSVKLSRFYTHQEKLRDTNGLFEVLAGIMKLGEKLGVLLIQLPPKLEYEEKVADHFFKCLRKIYAGPIALEARHPSWISDLAVASTQRFFITARNDRSNGDRGAPDCPVFATLLSAARIAHNLSE